MADTYIRICEVTEGEDFTAKVVTDANESTMDAELVPCGVKSDARVRFVSSDTEAEEYVLLVS